MAKDSAINLLAIDDDPACLNLIQEAVGQEHLEVIATTNPHTGLEMVRRRHPQIVLLDLRMPEMDGLELLQRIVDADPDVWKQIFDVNFFGAMHLIRAAAPVMADGSSIVLVNSGAALRNPPTMGAYAASKAALASLVRTAALELAPKIRVNGVFLGPVTGESLEAGAAATAEGQGVTVEEFFRQRAEELPIRHIPTPEECAGSVLFFASELAAPVTGQHLSVNGGQWVT